jgi:sulfotransferase
MAPDQHQRSCPLPPGMARMTEYHFIAGLPRSGSTLLSAIFNQNPAMTASITGPAASILNAVQAAVSERNEAAGFLTDEHRRKLLRHAIIDCHGDDKAIVLDTNRSWPTKLSLLASLFPECRLICCVRDIPWIVDSIEKLIRKNTLSLSGLFNFTPGMNVFDRARSLTDGGLIGSANMAMMEAFHGEHAKRMLIVEYDGLTIRPEETMRMIYEWLGMNYYDRHDFNAIQQIPGAAEFDKRMGTPGLHDLGPSVRNIPRETILPPELFWSFGEPFWRARTSEATVIGLLKGTPQDLGK